MKVLLSDNLSTNNCVFRFQSSLLMNQISAGAQMALLTVLLGVQLCTSIYLLGLTPGGMFSKTPFFVKKSQDLAELTSRLG